MLNTTSTDEGSGTSSPADKLVDSDNPLSTWQLGLFGPQRYENAVKVTTVGDSAYSDAIGTYRPVDGQTGWQLTTNEYVDGTLTNGYYFAWSSTTFKFSLYFVVDSVATPIVTNINTSAGYYVVTSGWATGYTVSKSSGEDVYCPNTEHLWPSIVGIHQERLIFAAPTLHPQTLALSVVADYDSFMPVNDENEVVDDQGLTYTLSGTTLNKIVWILSGPSLFIGTTGGEFVVITSSDVAPITPTDVAFIRQSQRGSIAGQTPQLIESSACSSKGLVQLFVILSIVQLLHLIRQKILPSCLIQFYQKLVVQLIVYIIQSQIAHSTILRLTVVFVTLL